MADRSLPLTAYTKGTSRCHGARCLIVRSRDGGMVSQNCIDCRKPYYISPSDFPDLACPSCGVLLVVRKTDGRSYFFECLQCKKALKVASAVPDWSDLFRYEGLAAFGDDFPALRRNVWNPTPINSCPMIAWQFAPSSGNLSERGAGLPRFRYVVDSGRLFHFCQFFQRQSRFS
jgi:hypothetical protein